MTQEEIILYQNLFKAKFNINTDETDLLIKKINDFKIDMLTVIKCINEISEAQSKGNYKEGVHFTSILSLLYQDVYFKIVDKYFINATKEKKWGDAMILKNTLIPRMYMFNDGFAVWCATHEKEYIFNKIEEFDAFCQAIITDHNNKDDTSEVEK